MGIGLAVWLAASALLAAPASPRLPAGTWPAGVLIAAQARIAARPVFADSPTIGNAPIVLERELLLATESLPALASLLFDAGIALVAVDPDRAEIGWLATTRAPGAARPIALSVGVLRLEYADCVEVARSLNAIAQAREANLPPGDIPSRFIADPRTSNIIVRTASAERLAEYLERLGALDRPPAPEELGEVLRVYRPTRGLASELLVAFEEAWRERGGVAITVVRPSGQNLLLIRCPTRVWEQVEPLLRELELGGG